MITFEKLDAVYAALSAYRGDGKDLVLFDSRDRGNYHGHRWPDTSRMLRRADPSGVAEALLLHEMVEATIDGSQVKLTRVLREDGYVAKLAKVLEIGREVSGLVSDAQARLLDRLEFALGSVSDSFGRPASREAAICLRDAIFCMDEGLKLRWLECSGEAVSGPLQILAAIPHFPDSTTFIEALRLSLPCGAHLVRIGASHTAIGLKTPGRIAYLSSLGIDTKTGQMIQHRATNSHMVEPFDLDTPVQRYPEWVKDSARRYGASYTVTKPSETVHELDHISKLPRDQLIWFAMVVDMASKQMAETPLGSVALTESLSNALPERQASYLPMVVSPNWTVDALGVDEMLDTLELSDWERRFIAPALEQVTPQMFMPPGNQDVGFNVATLEQLPWPDSHRFGALEQHDFTHRHARLRPLASDWVGIKSEIDAARKAIFGYNLAEYLMRWGNQRFAQLWETNKEWFVSKLRQNLREALSHPCAERCESHIRADSGAHIYSQSSRHKTYHPRCAFDGKKDVTDVLMVHPNSADDMVRVLGLASELELPVELRGWAREQAWTTTRHTDDAPWSSRARWKFRRRHIDSTGSRQFAASVAINALSFDVDSVPQWDFSREFD